MSFATKNAFPNSFMHAPLKQRTNSLCEIRKHPPLGYPLLVLLLLVAGLLLVLLLALAPHGALEAGADIGNGLANRLAEAARDAGDGLAEAARGSADDAANRVGDGRRGVSDRVGDAAGYAADGAGDGAGGAREEAGGLFFLLRGVVGCALLALGLLGILLLGALLLLEGGEGLGGLLDLLGSDGLTGVLGDGLGVEGGTGLVGVGGHFDGFDGIGVLRVWFCGLSCWLERDVLLVVVEEWLEWIGSDDVLQKDLKCDRCVPYMSVRPNKKTPPCIALQLHDDDGWRPKAGGELAESLLQWKLQRQSCPAILRHRCTVDQVPVCHPSCVCLSLTPALPFASI